MSYTNEVLDLQHRIYRALTDYVLAHGTQSNVIVDQELSSVTLSNPIHNLMNSNLVVELCVIDDLLYTIDETGFVDQATEVHLVDLANELDKLQKNS